MAKLYFYYSSMNAGKTTTLLQSSYNYHERGMTTVLYTPSIDTRYGLGKIASRIGLEKNAIAFDRDFNFLRDVEQKCQHQSPHCILIDEAQFLLKSQVLELVQVVDRLGIPVLCYGLRSDFRGEPFEGSQYLLAWADHLVELKGVCHCGRKATMNMRVDEAGNPVTEGETIEIGGNDRYVAVCRKHFLPLQAHTNATIEDQGI